MRLITLGLLILNIQNSWGHGGVDHSKKESMRHENIDTTAIDSIKLISDDYLKTVRPIFKKSCFDCHSNQTNFPWYYRIPGVKQLIDSDINEAKSHLDFSNDYPFISHESKVNDLKSIEKSISEGSMPPGKYLWLHGEAKLSDQDIQQIKRWVSHSLEALK